MNVYLLYGIIVTTVLAVLYIVYRNWNVETNTLFSFFRAVTKKHTRGKDIEIDTDEKAERKNTV